MNWANQPVLQSVLAVPAAQAESLPILAHMLAAEDVWLSAIEEARGEVSRLAGVLAR